MFDPSFTLIEPTVLPYPTGFEVTVMVQLAWGARVPGQSLVWAKCPLTVMLASVICEDEVWFVSVAVCGGLTVFGGTPAKERDGGLKSSDPIVPVPCNVTFCTPPAASSVMVRSSFLMPDESGRKAIVSEQDAPAFTIIGAVGHVVDERIKSCPNEIEEIVRGTV